MPNEFAFNWRPGLLEWMLILELIILLVLAAYRYVAYLLGRSAPTDAFVIFYRTFWKAFRTPSRYPIPVNYQPTQPKRTKPRLEEPLEGAGLTDEEIENLMVDSLAGGDGGETRRPAADGDAAPDDDEGQSTLEVHVVSGPSVAIESVDGGAMTIRVDVAPDDGRANRIVIEQACIALNLKPHQVGLQAGHTRADKTLRITGLSPGQLQQKLEDLSQAPGETIRFA